MNKPPSMLDMLFVLGERATDDVGEIFRQIIEHDDAPKINHEICYDLVEIMAGILMSDYDDQEVVMLDDFYDLVGIPEEYRSDYATGILMNQASFLVLNSY